MNSPALAMEDKVVVVTGGSRGLGKAMTLGFAEAGAEVVISSRRLDSCLELAKQVTEITGRRAIAIPAHVGRWAECDALCERAYSEFGRVDVLVNNAGVSPLYERPSEVSEELYDKVLNVNLRGPFRLTALFGERMIADGAGAVINISSVAALNPTPDIIPYAAAKAGLNAMTLSFARAYGPHVRVNGIMAGRFRTDVSNAWDMARVDAEVQDYALKRIGEPEEVVGTALYLASDASTYTTGSVIRVDGGSRY